jgi:hypothetical protein
MEVSMLFSRVEFEILFQVTKEVSNLEHTHLARAGVTSTEASELLALLQSIMDRIGRAVRVRIDLSGSKSRENVGNSSNGADDTVEHEVRGEIPYILAQHWHPLMEEVVLASSQREIYLRTGYNLDEIGSAAGKVRVIQ